MPEVMKLWLESLSSSESVEIIEWLESKRDNQIVCEMLDIISE